MEALFFNHLDVGHLQRELGNKLNALTMYEESFPLAKELYTRSGKEETIVLEMLVYISLSNVLFELNKHDDANQCMKLAMTIQEELSSLQIPDTMYLEEERMRHNLNTLEASLKEEDFQ